LKLKYYELPLNLAFKFNLRRYSKGKMSLNILAGALQAPRQARSSVGGQSRMAEDGAAAAAAGSSDYRGPEVEPIPRSALEQVVREAGGVLRILGTSTRPTLNRKNQCRMRSYER